MSKKPLPQGPTPPARADETAPKDTSGGQGWRGVLAQQLFGSVMGPVSRLISAVLLGAGGIFLGMAWQTAPQGAVDAARYAKYTQQVQGTIVESWLALEVNTVEIRLPENWRASARATPCALVEYEAAWGPRTRRAFCGDPRHFSTDEKLHEIRELISGVPFVWARDAAGFIIPEIRISAGTRLWLATNGFDRFLHLKWPIKSALDELRIDLDRPVDNAVSGWIAPAATMPLAFDPQQPAEVMPAGYVAAHRQWHPSTLILSVVIGAMGLGVWFAGVTMLLGDGVALPARVLVAVLPLVALPWWGERFPRALSHLNPQWASMMSDIWRDMEGADRLVASEPADATLAGGERLIWRAGEGIYADTFGQVRYALPQPAPASAEAALATLAQTVTAQTRALSDDEQVEMFSRLQRNTENDLIGAVLVFLPSEKEAALDHKSVDVLWRAQRAFISARLLAQSGRPAPTDLGHHDGERLNKEARVVKTRHLASPKNMNVLPSKSLPDVANRARICGITRCRRADPDDGRERSGQDAGGGSPDYPLKMERRQVSHQLGPQVSKENWTAQACGHPDHHRDHAPARRWETRPCDPPQ
jgi:hypothetical protein